jgi:hypothetical protein
MLLIHQIVLVLDSKVPNVRHSCEVFECTQMPFFSFIGVYDNRLLLVPIVVPLGKYILKRLE